MSAASELNHQPKQHEAPVGVPDFPKMCKCGKPVGFEDYEPDLCHSCTVDKNAMPDMDKDVRIAKLIRLAEVHQASIDRYTDVISGWRSYELIVETKLRRTQHLLDDQIKVAENLQRDLAKANIRVANKSGAIAKLQDMLAKDVKRRHLCELE